jgi:hypothetical protein
MYMCSKVAEGVECMILHPGYDRVYRMGPSGRVQYLKADVRCRMMELFSY